MTKAIFVPGWAWPSLAHLLIPWLTSFYLCLFSFETYCTFSQFLHCVLCLPLKRLNVANSFKAEIGHAYIDCCASLNAVDNMLHHIRNAGLMVSLLQMWNLPKCVFCFWTASAKLVFRSLGWADCMSEFWNQFSEEFKGLLTVLKFACHS